MQQQRDIKSSNHMMRLAPDSISIVIKEWKPIGYYLIT
jgi:hypothetical protein